MNTENVPNIHIIHKAIAFCAIDQRYKDALLERNPNPDMEFRIDINRITIKFRYKYRAIFSKLGILETVFYVFYYLEDDRVSHNQDHYTALPSMI